MPRLQFKGKHDKLKSLCWLLLRDHPGLSAAQVASIVGTSHESAATLLKRWTKWRYVVRGKAPGARTYIYRTSITGEQWLGWHFEDMPLDSWLRELPPESFQYFRAVFERWARERLSKENSVSEGV